jgi:3-deoxy-D-manno-octulosonic-acid transferase
MRLSAGSLEIVLKMIKDMARTYKKQVIIVVPR